MYQYFAITFLGEQVQDCRAVARYKDGVFELLTKNSHQWLEDSSLFGIFSGDFNDYEQIDEPTAQRLEERLCAA